MWVTHEKIIERSFDVVEEAPSIHKDSVLTEHSNVAATGTATLVDDCQAIDGTAKTVFDLSCQILNRGANESAAQKQR